MAYRSMKAIMISKRMDLSNRSDTNSEGGVLEVRIDYAYTKCVPFLRNAIILKGLPIDAS